MTVDVVFFNLKDGTEDGGHSVSHAKRWVSMILMILRGIHPTPSKKTEINNLQIKEGN